MASRPWRPVRIVRAGDQGGAPVTPEEVTCRRGDHLAPDAAPQEPERLALVDGEREVTYAELHANATRLANALLGVAAPGDRIA